MLRKLFLLQLAVSIAFLSITLGPYTSAADTCPNYEMTGDADFWEYLGNRGISYWELRDWIAADYNLQEGDWDGGWGYKKWDEPDAHRYAYPKMMNAGALLWFGIDDYVPDHSTWETRSMSGPEGEPAVVSRNPDSIDVFGRASDGRLRHVSFFAGSSTWDLGETSPSATSEYVNLRGPKGLPLTLTSDVAVVSRSQDILEVFFAAGGQPFLATWSGTSWETLDLISYVGRRPGGIPYYPYYIHTKPVVIQRTADTLDLFAFDTNYDFLIHYYWSQTSGWAAEDISQMVGWPSVSINHEGDIVAISRNANSLDVFIRNYDGELIHYYGSPSAGWSVENLTQALGGNFPINSDPVVVSRREDTLDVFARHDFHLIHYYWSSSTGWGVENLTQQLGGEPVFGNLAAVSRSADTLNVFGRGGAFQDHLIQYYWSSAAGWGTEDLTAARPTGTGGTITLGHRIDGNPVALGSQDRIDVFASTQFGHLIHYYWTPTASWYAENAHCGPNLSATFDKIVGDTIVVHRRDYSIDVIGKEDIWVRHFTSALGWTLTSWHTNEEYWKWAAGSRHQFKYIPGTDDAWANADRGFWVHDRVEMNCYSFNGTDALHETYPALRASSMVHEATHMNTGDEAPHSCNPPESDCEEDDRLWDYWDFHPLRSGPGGTLGAGVSASASNYIIPDPFHSPYQLDIEYLCDIGQFPSDSIPASAYDDAQAQANTEMNNRILNPPGWTCGDPRPLP